jgi:hypothetical protein
VHRAAKWNTHHNLHFFLWDIRTTDVVFRVDISSPGQILTFFQLIQCLPNLCKPFEFVRVGRQANYTPLAENASFKELAKYSALLERAKYAWASGESPACGCSERKASIS